MTELLATVAVCLLNINTATAPELLTVGYTLKNTLEFINQRKLVGGWRDLTGFTPHPFATLTVMGPTTCEAQTL